MMETESNTNADAKEAETSTQLKHRESKNQGRGVKSSKYHPENYTDTAQQNVSRSSETPEGFETDMNDAQIGHTSSSPGKGEFSFFNFFSVTSVMEKGKLIPGSGKD